MIWLMYSFNSTLTASVQFPHIKYFTLLQISKWYIYCLFSEHKSFPEVHYLLSAPFSGHHFIAHKHRIFIYVYIYH